MVFRQIALSVEPWICEILGQRLHQPTSTRMQDSCMHASIWLLRCLPHFVWTVARNTGLFTM